MGNNQIKNKVNNKLNNQNNVVESPGANKAFWIMFNFLLFFIFLAVLIVGGFLLYENIPGKPVILDSNVQTSLLINEEDSDEGESSKQFYSNMKFNHKDISYKIELNCEDNKRERVLIALDLLSKEVGNIKFHAVSNNPDIEISCSEQVKSAYNPDYFIGGEGGAKEVIQTGRYNIINQGVIYLYEDNIGSLNCDYPSVEMHELMHVFGFGHSENKNSLMYAYLESCNQKLDSFIIQELKRLYAEENLADLYIENLKTVKKGRYLDFNITIKNSGSVNANNVSFSVLSDGKVAGTNELEDITYGAGVTISIQNFKLNERNPKEIKFVLDRENRINEIDKENNVAIVKLE